MLSNNELFVFNQPELFDKATTDFGLVYTAIISIDSIAKVDCDTIVSKLISTGIKHFITVGDCSDETHDMIDSSLYDLNLLGDNVVTSYMDDTDSTDEIVNFALNAKFSNHLLVVYGERPDKFELKIIDQIKELSSY